MGPAISPTLARCSKRRASNEACSEETAAILAIPRRLSFYAHRSAGRSVGLRNLSARFTACSELIDDLATESGLSKADAKRALYSFFDVTSSVLKKRDRVALVGFGSFSISKGAVADPGDPGATLPSGKRLKPLKVRHRSGNRAAGTFDDFTFDAAAPEPDYHGALYRSVHADVATDPCAGAVLGDRLGFDGDVLCSLCTFDADMRDRVITAMQAATGLDPASLSSFLDAVLLLSYPPPLRDATSLSGLGSVSVSKCASRTGRNPQTGKEIKIAAKKVVKFKAGADLASKVN